MSTVGGFVATGGAIVGERWRSHHDNPTTVVRVGSMMYPRTRIVSIHGQKFVNLVLKILTMILQGLRGNLLVQFSEQK